MGTFLQDIRYAFRTLAKSPGFTAIVVLTLALGIGANTAIFSVVNVVLLAPLPYDQPSQLVRVWISNIPRGDKIAPASGGDFAEWKSGNNVFSGMAASSDEIFTLTGAGDPENVIGYQFSADYFRLLGTRPELGRTFLDEEDRPGGPDVVVLRDAIRKPTFSADPHIERQTIPINGKPSSLAGRMPPNYNLPYQLNTGRPWRSPHHF